MRCLYLFASLLLFLSRGGYKDIVIIADTTQPDPGLYETEPWLAAPCVSPDHCYLKPLEVTGEETYPTGCGEADTSCPYTFDTRFLYDKRALGWRPWENHYACGEDGFVKLDGSSQCIYEKDRVRDAVWKLVTYLLRDDDRRIALCCALGSGDMRFCTNFTADGEKLENILYAAPGCAAGDMGAVLQKAGAYIDRRERDDARTRPAAVVVITANGFGEGSYAARAYKKAQALGEETALFVLDMNGARAENAARIPGFAVMEKARILLP